MQLYFIAQVLPPHLDEKVRHWKEYMYEKYGCKVGLKSPSHITLVPPFWMDETFEEALLNDSNRAVQKTAPFEISTNNFSSFKARTLFIDVLPNEHLTALKASVDAHFSSHPSYKIKIDTRPFHPHITIATRDILKRDFYEAWPLFQKEIFTAQWMAKGISVLRHNQKAWDIIYTPGFPA